MDNHAFCGWLFRKQGFLVKKWKKAKPKAKLPLDNSTVVSGSELGNRKIPDFLPKNRMILIATEKKTWLLNAPDENDFKNLMNCLIPVVIPESVETCICKCLANAPPAEPSDTPAPSKKKATSSSKACSNGGKVYQMSNGVAIGLPMQCDKSEGDARTEPYMLYMPNEVEAKDKSPASEKFKTCLSKCCEELQRENRHLMTSAKKSNNMAPLKITCMPYDQSQTQQNQTTTVRTMSSVPPFGLRSTANQQTFNSHKQQPAQMHNCCCCFIPPQQTQQAQQANNFCCFIPPPQQMQQQQMQQSNNSCFMQQPDYARQQQQGGGAEPQATCCICCTMPRAHLESKLGMTEGGRAGSPYNFSTLAAPMGSSSSSGRSPRLCPADLIDLRADNGRSRGAGADLHGNGHSGSAPNNALVGDNDMEMDYLCRLKEAIGNYKPNSCRT